MHSPAIVTAFDALANELERPQNSTRTALAHNAGSLDCGDAATPGAHEPMHCGGAPNENKKAST